MVGRSLDAHNECSAPAPLEDAPCTQQLISTSQPSIKRDGNTN